MDYDSICNIFHNDEVQEGMKFITCDIARFGKDKTTIFVWSGFRVIHIETIQKGDLVFTSNTIHQVATKYYVERSNIIVDEDGVGGGVVDMLRCKGFVSNKSPIKRGNGDFNYNNIKSQCYFMLAKFVNERRIWVQTDNNNIKDELMQELEVVKKDNLYKDGKNAVLKKEVVKDMIGRSPDYSDALMMRMYFELGRNETKVDWI
jgi:hypothetical protein